MAVAIEFRSPQLGERSAILARPRSRRCASPSNATGRRQSVGAVGRIAVIATLARRQKRY
jgi:hypothetical protein